MRFLFFLFILVPILEIWVLLKVGGAIGGLSTIALIIITAAIGIALLRQQSLQTLLRARTKLDQGEAPAGEIVEGLLIAVGGCLLLTPGFVTDTLGFCCLIPAVRQALIRMAMRKGLAGHTSFQSRSSFSRTHSATREEESRTIEGEYQREDEPRK